MPPRPSPPLLFRVVAATSLLAVALALATACGARASLPGEDDATADAAADSASSERHCPPECYAGHRCCAGGCDGPVVPMPSDCCTCLPGEVSSFHCPDGTCGN